MRYDKLIDALFEYNMFNMKSIALFIATCSAETDCGSLENLLERGDNAYFATKRYSKKNRGAGYLQITGQDQETYLMYKLGKKKMKRYSTKDYATWIAKKYPWDSASWEWTKQKKETM